MQPRSSPVSESPGAGGVKAPCGAPTDVHAVATGVEPEDLLDEIRAQTAERGLSAYVAEHCGPSAAGASSSRSRGGRSDVVSDVALRHTGLCPGPVRCEG